MTNEEAIRDIEENIIPVVGGKSLRIACNALRAQEKEPNIGRKYALTTGLCPMCEDCPDGCPVETPKDSRNIITNADRIRSMSDEELARWLVDATVCERVCGEDEYCHGNECVERVTRWLKQPSKEEHHETD